MIEINGRQLCENCFEPVKGAVCKSCGFKTEDNSPDTSLLKPGTILLNRYVIGRTIGKGGFGVTYLAYDALVGKKIAIKEYFPHGSAQRVTESAEVSVTSADSEEAFRQGTEKFYNEAKLVSRFNGNPNIVCVYDCFYENSTVYMAMEYLDGCTLKDYIREHGVLSPSKALYAAKAIVNALIVAHSANVLHRDITPDNVILCKNGDIKLIDFGAARQVVAELSQTLTAILKPGFAPPEQYSKKGNQGPWTDVYSVGTTLYFMLTADIPDDPSARFDEDDTFKENTYDIDSALWKVIAKATKLRMNDRYADAYELKKALDAVEIKPEPIIVPAADTEREPSDDEAADNTRLKVSIKAPKPKQSFFKKHLRTIIEVTCAVLVAAIIIPLVIQVNKLSSAPNTSGSSDASGSVSDVLGTSGNIESAVFGDGSDLDKEGFSKPLYSCLGENDKALYGRLYNGFRSSQERIEIPAHVYSVAIVARIFDDIINDNPALNNIRGYTVDYIDFNDNKQPDDDESVHAVIPTYTGESPADADEYIKQAFAETDLDETDPIECLRYFHDKLILECDLLARNATPTASTTHGAFVEHKADDLGVSRALCDIAQRLGYTSFVADTRFGDYMDMAVVRVLIEGKWYNIAIIVNTAMNVDNIERIPLDENGQISHQWFLDSDFYQNRSGLFEYKRDFGEIYGALFPEPVGISVSDGQAVIPKMNYYIEEHLGETYHHAEYANVIYQSVLSQTETVLNSGKTELYCYMLAQDADGLYDLMQESYIEDIEKKYGVTITGFTAEFSGDRVIVKIEM